jgi:preprotein translocase subunit SecF
LLIFGAGTIKGFGLTLLVGIILSMFTSLLLNRFLVKAFVDLVPEGEAAFSLKRSPEVEAENKEVVQQDETPENNEGGNE